MRSQRGEHGWLWLTGLLTLACTLVAAGSGIALLGEHEQTADDLLASQRLDLARRLDELALSVLHVHPAVRDDVDTEADLSTDIEDELEQAKDALEDLFAPYPAATQLEATMEPLEDVVDSGSLVAVPWIRARVIAAELHIHADSLIGAALDPDDPIAVARRHGNQLVELVVDELTGEAFDATAYAAGNAALADLVADENLIPAGRVRPEELPPTWELDPPPDFDTFDALSELVTALDEAAVPSQTDGGAGIGRWMLIGSSSSAIAFGAVFALLLWSTRKVGREREAELHRRAATDELTGLLNRTQLDVAARAVRKANNRGLGVIYLDMDGFKDVNDAHGHHVGDLLLIEAARRINGLVRTGDHAIRIGGDEFIVFVGDIGDIEDLRRTGQRLIEAIGEPVIIEGSTIDIGASAGCVFVAGAFDEIDAVVRDADAALYAAKRSGGRRIVVSAANEDRPTARPSETETEPEPGTAIDARASTH